MKKILILALIAFGSCKVIKPTAKVGIQPKFEKNICRGNGRVVVIDSTQTVIRIKGVIIKNDSCIANYRYILAVGSFGRLLQNYNGEDILFECEGIIPNRFYGEDILPAIKGCVEACKHSYTSK
jgi:hypothetical protein